MDHVHAVTLANAVLDDVRRRTQHSPLGHRGHKNNPLYGTRRLLTRRWERLTDRPCRKLFDALAEGDPDDEVAACILGKELLREVSAAPTLHQAYRRLVRFCVYAAEADISEITRLATTISRREQEVLNYHVTGIPTGPVEAQHLANEKIRRISVYRPWAAGWSLTVCATSRTAGCGCCSTQGFDGTSPNGTNQEASPTARRVEPVFDRRALQDSTGVHAAQERPEPRLRRPASEPRIR